MLNKTGLYYLTVGALSSTEFEIRYAKKSDIAKNNDNNEIIVTLGHDITVEQITNLKNTLQHVLGMQTWITYGTNDTMRIEFI